MYRELKYHYRIKIYKPYVRINCYVASHPSVCILPRTIVSKSFIMRPHDAFGRRQAIFILLYISGGRRESTLRFRRWKKVRAKKKKKGPSAGPKGFALRGAVQGRLEKWSTRNALAVSATGGEN